MSLANNYKYAVVQCQFLKGNEENMNYLVICASWIMCESGKTICYWPNKSELINKKEVTQCGEIDFDTWKKVPITKIIKFSSELVDAVWWAIVLTDVNIDVRKFSNFDEAFLKLVSKKHRDGCARMKDMYENAVWLCREEVKKTRETTASITTTGSESESMSPSLLSGWQKRICKENTNQSSVSKPQNHTYLVPAATSTVASNNESISPSFTSRWFNTNRKRTRKNLSPESPSLITLSTRGKYNENKRLPSIRLTTLFDEK